jgi:hypothetical protein
VLFAEPISAIHPNPNAAGEVGNMGGSGGDGAYEDVMDEQQVDYGSEEVDVDAQGDDSETVSEEQLEEKFMIEALKDLDDQCIDDDDLSDISLE